MSEKIQLLCFGFGLGLTVFAVTPAIETQPKVEVQRPSIFDVEPAETVENEREEVIESGTAEESAESTEPKSLPLDPQQASLTTDTTIAVQSLEPAAFTMNGKRYELQSFIAAHYRRPWTYPGGIDSHLLTHGVDSWSIQSLSHSQKEQLHAAIHEQELQTVTVVPKSTVTTYQSNCPGGVCPSPQYQQVTRRQQRRGLFGWVR